MLFDDDMNGIELEGLVVTPGEILERMKEMTRTVTSLDTDIANNPVCAADTVFMSDWEKFKVDFAVYLREFEGFFDRFWGSAMDVADKWAEQIANWQKRYARTCKKPASGINLSDNTAGNPKLPTLSVSTKWIIGILVGVGVAGGAYYMYKVRK